VLWEGEAARLSPIPISPHSAAPCRSRGFDEAYCMAYAKSLEPEAQ